MRMMPLPPDVSVSDLMRLMEGFLSAPRVDWDSHPRQLSAQQRARREGGQGEADGGGSLQDHRAGGQLGRDRASVGDATVQRQAGADPNTVMVGGDRPIHAALRSQIVDNVELLLDHGAATDIASANGTTTRELAMSSRNQDLIELIMSQPRRD